jgi:hypothetical protein
MDYIEKILDTQKPDFQKEDPKPDLRIIDTDFELLEKAQSIKKQSYIKKKTLVDKLNYINFQNESIRVNFIHNKDKTIVSYDTLPQPCFGNRLTCLWTEKPNLSKLLDAYQFQDITFIDGQNLVTVKGVFRSVSPKGICVTLPDTATVFSARKERRFTCEKLNVSLMQNGIVLHGSLIDFSANSFRIEIVSSISEPFQCINSKDLTNLLISFGKEYIYTGQCKIIKQSGGPKQKNIILQPVHDAIQRFTPKTYRSHRLELSPSPDIAFNHPFTDTYVTLKVINISGSGLAVEDDEESSVLVPGMIIPDLKLNFANNFWIHCKAQVVYRKIFEIDGANKIVKCGIVFLDMNPNDHMRLMSVLHQANEKHLYISNKVDMNELWNFFFKSGFIYPRKYSAISDNKEAIKETFKKIYACDSSIIRNFTWQKKGRIIGHLSMLRFYENTWLIHHLAALKSDQKFKIGTEILKQIGSYIYDSYRLYSSQMSYLMCYFRTENKFPNHFFGGVAQHINNTKICSIDPFAYVHYHCQKNQKAQLNTSYTLTKTTYEDLVELENFYENTSKGLMIRACDLSPEPEMTERNNLANEYNRLNLKRKRLIYSLKRNESLKAVLQLNISDASLNLSNLTNCITIFAIETENLTIEILFSAISELSHEYELKRIPVLVYPQTFADSSALPYEKIYNLWVLETQFSDEYFKHLENLFS